MNKPTRLQSAKQSCKTIDGRRKLPAVLFTLHAALYAGLSASLLFVLPGPSTAAEKQPYGLTVTAVGDVRITAALINAHSEELKKIHLKGDVVFANFEGLIGDPVFSDPWKFSVPPQAAEVMRKMGINAVSMANNHSLDLGEKAYRETASTLLRNGFWVTGGNEQEIVARIRDHRVRVIAFSFVSPHNNVNEPAAIPASFTKEPGEILIISAHMGGENPQGSWIPGTMEYFGDEQRGDVIAFSHRCIDAGADLVLGHSPHLPRGIELYKGKLIVYSLGNFAFDYPGASFHPHAPGYSISVDLNTDGSFRCARIHSYDLRQGVPVPDRSERAYRMIRDLALRNLKQTTLAFPGNGRVERSSEE
jgi:poly-gamma-glutamate capsule biosynthesis protein CapA/YwtB (metallophosphatase superfamily)